MVELMVYGKLDMLFIRMVLRAREGWAKLPK